MIRLNQKICGYELDEQQKQIVLDESNHLLVVAGAGSGKTLTILGKLYYLVEKQKVCPNQIICISFTKASSESLKGKIKQELKCFIPVYTFHKLALQILKDKYYQIAASNTLDEIIEEFFNIDILNNPYYLNKLCKYFRIKQRDYQKYINKNDSQIQILKKTLNTFIHLFKCNNYRLKDFLIFLKRAKFSILSYSREKFLLILALNIYLKYENYLKANHELDFDDMLIKAIEHVKQNKWSSPIKYIIIDEYQDTSFLRLQLIKSILEKTKAKLMVVGDDFQSIYRFTGCDLSLFLNFQNYFENAKIMKIENTYRNSQELIELAGSFVMKNKEQIRKNLHSNKRIDYPIIIAYYKNAKHDFISLIIKIYEETKQPILILGRNNRDINNVVDKRYFKIENDKIIYLKNKQIKLYYLTVHKSKGLEEENVIIINLQDSLLGFPSKIKEEKIFRFISPQASKFPYSEERRLFYVALTRTKNKVYLFTPKNNPSIFLKELLKNNRNKLIEYVL